MNTLKDLSVFVSGSAKGIGKAIAARFIEQGANVDVPSRSKQHMRAKVRKPCSDGFIQKRERTNSATIVKNAVWRRLPGR